MTAAVRGYTDNEMDDLFEQFVSKPGKSAREWLEELGDSKDEWIIPGLVCDSLTMIYGKPESGKSTLAVNITAALSNGSPVFGIPSRSGETPQKILIVGTEANTRQEYPRRLERAGANLDNIALEYAGSGRVSRDAVFRAEHGGIDLVVVDNVQGLTDGNDTVDAATAKLVYDKVHPFIDAMVPVILIHHASTAHRDSARGNRMSGNTQFEAMARWHVEVQKENGSDRRLLGRGNMDTPHTFKVRVDNDLVMSLRDAPVQEDKPERGGGQSRSPSPGLGSRSHREGLQPGRCSPGDRTKGRCQRRHREEGSSDRRNHGPDHPYPWKGAALHQRINGYLERIFADIRVSVCCKTPGQRG